jgi:hypothetical protein
LCASRDWRKRSERVLGAAASPATFGEFEVVEEAIPRAKELVQRQVAVPVFVPALPKHVETVLEFVGVER